MCSRLLASLLPVFVVLLAKPAATEPPPVLECRGHEPEWSLRIDGASATLATLEAVGLTQAALEGRLATSGRPVAFVYRGRSRGSTADLVAVITREACVDSMADAPEGGGPRDYTARVSLPDGALRQGCCAVAAAPPAPASPATAPALAPPPAPRGHGEITALTLSDGRECRRAGNGGPFTARGHRLDFDCGISDGNRLGIVGPLVVESSGLLVARRAVAEWSVSEGAPPELPPLAARVTEIALSDGLTCRHAGTGATLAFGGRRATYTCGTKDGDSVALLGELEPAEGGFRILRARVAHGETGFTLRASEPILVTAPR